MGKHFQKPYGDNFKPNQSIMEERINTYYLNDRVFEFINWYNSETNECETKKLRNFIEKMAVWYELRYPYCENETIDAAYEMFDKNEYFQKCLEEGHGIDWDGNTVVVETFIAHLNWGEFYNPSVFVSTLSLDEKKILNVKYPSEFKFRMNGCIHEYNLTSDGHIRDKHNNSSRICIVDALGERHIFDYITIEELVIHLKESKFGMNPNRIEKIENIIKIYKKECYIRDEFLNCVMYRIIERGGNRIGPRRALLFAKEFNRDINIPMMYGVDTSDPNLSDFINKYINIGGSKDLKCYINYFSNSIASISTISIQELLNEQEFEKDTKGLKLERND